MPIDNQHPAADYDMNSLLRGALPDNNDDDNDNKDAGNAISGPRTRAQRAADQRSTVIQGREIPAVNLAHFNVEHEPIMGRLSQGRTVRCITCIINKTRRCSMDTESLFHACMLHINI